MFVFFAKKCQNYDKANIIKLHTPKAQFTKKKPCKMCNTTTLANYTSIDTTIFDITDHIIL